MADKSPGKPSGKKPGKTLKEKRTAKKLKRRGAGPIETMNQRPTFALRSTSSAWALHIAGPPAPRMPSR
jgi:hypothetical protein